MSRVVDVDVVVVAAGVVVVGAVALKFAALDARNIASDWFEFSRRSPSSWTSPSKS